MILRPLEFKVYSLIKGYWVLWVVCNPREGGLLQQCPPVVRLDDLRSIVIPADLNPKP